MEQNEPITGSIDTNVRLLAQRVSSVEHHLDRLGDTVRANSTDIHKIQADLTNGGDFANYRLQGIEKSLDNFATRQKEVTNRYWQLVIGVAIALVSTFLLVYLRLR